ncbi:MAG: PLP-dependent transferase, partial [Burkholderiaceae bacterium]
MRADDPIRNDSSRKADAGQPAARTRVVDAGRRFDVPIATANLPVSRASTVLFDSLAEADAIGGATARGELHASTYGTAGTQSTLALADALVAVEAPGHDCRAALMPSGLAAISAALLAFLSPGDHLLVPDSVYGPTRALCDGMLAGLGVQTEYYDPAIGAGIAALIRPQTRLVYLESPGSYTFEIQDVPAICAVARARGVLTMIDNAWASPAFARPFDWGVDASILPL